MHSPVRLVQCCWKASLVVTSGTAAAAGGPGMPLLLLAIPSGINLQANSSLRESKNLGQGGRGVGG